MKNRIDYWRVRLGMTYQYIAERSDLSAQYVSMLAKGQRGNPCAATMQKIATATGKEVSQVFMIGEKRA